MYIEPCCAPRQLPEVIKSGQMFFQTSGDVTLKRLLEGCASMAGDDHTMLLAVPEVDIPMLRLLHTHLQRNWTLGLLLITQSAQTELVSSELSAYLPRVHYAADPLILDGLCCLFGPQRALILQGAMLSKPDFALSLYSVYLGSRREVIQAATDALIAKLRTKALLNASETCDHVKRVLNRQYLQQQ